MDTVIIDGVIRKKNRVLSTVTANPMTETGVSAEQDLDWSHTRDKLIDSYDDINQRISELSINKARDMMVETWHIDTSKFVDVQSTEALRTPS